MKTNISWKSLVIVVTLGVALLGIPAYSSVSKVIAVGTSGGDSIHKPAHSRPALFSSTRNNISVATTDAVTDWNAIMQMTVAPTNPFFQARSAAIVQLAVFEAVNAILKDYEPYLGTIAAPTGA